METGPIKNVKCKAYVSILQFVNESIFKPWMEALKGWNK